VLDVAQASAEVKVAAAGRVADRGGAYIEEEVEMKWIVCALCALALPACRKQDPEPAQPSALPVASSAALPVSSTAPAPEAVAPAKTEGARSWSFDGDTPGEAPRGFSFARTGEGREPRFVIEASGDAPSKPNVLVQRDADPTDFRFPMAVVEGASFTDVDLSVSCKAVSGKVDRACGLVWRYQDADNYYVTRANALEGNVRIYYVKAGKRVQLESWRGEVPTGAWVKLRVEAKGDHFVVSFGGAKILDVKDSTFSGAGKVGVWTKADSVTEFDDLSARPL